MDKDFNLDKVGKRMPYTTPEGFLDQLEANVWQEVKADMNMHQTKPRRKLYRLSIVLIHLKHIGLVVITQLSISLLNRGKTISGSGRLLWSKGVNQDDVFLNEQQQ